MARSKYGMRIHRLEQSLTHGLARAWYVSYQRGKQGIAVGFDDGAVVVKMGREEPAVSMDNSGKMIWARHSEILSAVIKGGDATIKDGSPISLPAKFTLRPLHVLPIVDSSQSVVMANISSTLLLRGVTRHLVLLKILRGAEALLSVFAPPLIYSFV